MDLNRAPGAFDAASFKGRRVQFQEQLPGRKKRVAVSKEERLAIITAALIYEREQVAQFEETRRRRKLSMKEEGDAMTAEQRVKRYEQIHEAWRFGK